MTQQIGNLKRAVTRLIDAYEQGLLEKCEFEPRLRRTKERLSRLEDEASQLARSDRS